MNSSFHPSYGLLANKNFDNKKKGFLALNNLKELVNRKKQINLKNHYLYENFHLQKTMNIIKLLTQVFAFYIIVRVVLLGCSYE